MKRLVCIHGHFYQPPRESPWLELIEDEPSAAPHANWNARITEECYAPNAAARILDGAGRVARLFDNYAHMSFNFGPTLLRWFDDNEPELVEALVRADRASVARLGHGNAMAQVYNHAILPLCNKRDKRTQVRWGLADFKHRFGRDAECIWLAETAIDQETVDVLIEEGVRFTVLSPHQARRCKPDHDGGWHDCSHGNIPTGRAWRVKGSGGGELAVFFYDGAIAKGIAFERMLADSSHLVGAVLRAHANRRCPPDEPWLIHTATDGESYGHHFRFGDMALAAALAKLQQDPDTELVNYGAFLARAGTRGEVELHAVSAWSCAHGVSRWERDCGCRFTSDPGWTMRWRTGLRTALNRLRDDLAVFFEQQASHHVADPWALRDAAVELVLDRQQTDAVLTRFVQEPLTPQLGEKLCTLLELQRAALLMFTSCGWFFDDISGPESVILLKYAARAILLADRLSPGMRARLEEGFLVELAAAESNVRRPDGSRQTGRDIYLERVLPAAVDPHRVVAAVALWAATGGTPGRGLHAWEILTHEEHHLPAAAVPCVAGSVTLLDARTRHQCAWAYVVVGLGGVDWRGLVVPPAELPGLLARLAPLSDGPSLWRAIETAACRGRPFGVADAFGAVRDEVATAPLLRRLLVAEGVLQELLLDRPLLRGAVSAGGHLSPDLRFLVGHALTRRAMAHVDAILAGAGLAPELRRLRAALHDASIAGVTLDLSPAARHVDNALARALDRCLKDPGPSQRDDVARLLELHALLGGTQAQRPLSRALPRAAALAVLLGRLHSAQAPAAGAVAALGRALDAACGSAFFPAD